MATNSENESFAKTILSQYPLDEAIEWIKKNLSPEDVFNEKELAEWAKNNGYEEVP